MLLSQYTRRTELSAVSATTVNFSATGVSVRPIKLAAPSGRMASLTALPSAVTISGGAGTKYVYASLAAPAGAPYSTTGPTGLLDRLLSALPWPRADWVSALQYFHPGDGSLALAAQQSAVTLVMTTSATPPDTHHVPLGEVAWDGAAITSLTSYLVDRDAGVTVTAVASPRSYLAGLILANNGVDATNDIDIASGMARDSTDVDTLVLTALTKRLDAVWAVGTNQGGLDTGSKAANTWYHLWAIKRPDTGVVDALFSTSATAPTMPANYNRKRRLGAVRTDAGPAILAFSQRGDLFLWVTPILDLSADVTEAATSRTLTVPSGVVVEAHVNVAGDFTAADQRIYLSSLVQTDQAPSQTVAPLATLTIASTANGAAFGPIRVLTNTSSQIRTRTEGTLDGLSIATLGWVDRRGRDD